MQTDRMFQPKPPTPVLLEYRVGVDVRLHDLGHASPAEEHAVLESTASAGADGAQPGIVDW
jgi:hypothetical protein